eukprot:CCRYP_013720-RA/>CCRYP_013720-RA protein AED:0.30 eAED:0.30 QI:1778/0.66/0.75/1/0/0/4/0/126
MGSIPVNKSAIKLDVEKRAKIVDILHANPFYTRAPHQRITTSIQIIHLDKCRRKLLEGGNWRIPGSTKCNIVGLERQKGQVIRLRKGSVVVAGRKEIVVADSEVYAAVAVRTVGAAIADLLLVPLD